MAAAITFVSKIKTVLNNFEYVGLKFRREDTGDFYTEIWDGDNHLVTVNQNLSRKAMHACLEAYYAGACDGRMRGRQNLLNEIKRILYIHDTSASQA